MEFLSEQLRKIASDSTEVDQELAEELNFISAELEELEKENQIQDEVDAARFEVQKQAKLINPGERVVCVDPTQGLYKGRLYLCSDNSIPGFIAIKEDDGSDVGIFEVNRFLLDQKEY